MPGSQNDRQLLHYYCCQASWTLSAYTDPTLWTELILQRSHHEPVVRNALIALSSLHKDYLCGDFQPATASDGAPRLTPPAKTTSMIAKCHRQLRNYLSRNDASPQVALTCSLIFYTFESLLGDSEKAIWHLDRGLMLLKQCHLDSDGQDDPLIVHLTTLLHNLDTQASAFDDRRAPILNLVSDTESKGVIDLVPESFPDISHAERILTKLQNWTLNYLVKQVGHKGRATDGPPAEFLHERLVLARQFDRFAQALADLTAAHEIKATTENEAQQRLDTQKLLLCQIHFHSFQHLLSEYLSTHISRPTIKPNPYPYSPSGPSLWPELARPIPSHNPNAHTLHTLQTALETTLSSITSLLSLPHPKCQPTPTSPRTYTLSTNLIAALYFISLKTTNPQTLSSALDLFSHPTIAHSRDGLWDARTASFVVQNLLKLRPNGDHHSRLHEGTNDPQPQRTIRPYIPSDTSDASEMQKIQNMSNQHNLPMMQSRRLTVVMLAPAPEDEPNPKETATTQNSNDLLLLPPYLPSVIPPFRPGKLQKQQTSRHFTITSSSTSPFPKKDQDCEQMSSLRESWPPVSDCRVPTTS
ncbi:hypothetical protein LTS07_005095 [Exophiala sideris]|uniref:Uncharacterized protein n=1 Tax=Exophiala sideris TaxID=1016849 RepID=A0ABR0JCD3_9EURO|nr:hypothetical protein LTS07_005095 [Exophiala sideris]KAK5039080.1 hypothetical protein LTR13_004111 [Exophiala sideris]KAK5060965.1 hypothetical protein LTR69_005564 [Exophiala sideris]KAK5183876.1 hypothetical protein LTR44_004158 [Eurotiomycetes sp. CCFEE 6388]